MANFKPVIKWSGSKRSQADEIVKYFPTNIDTYYEPFIGGGSMLMILMLNSDTIKVKHYICSDINKGLIDLWNSIKDKPQEAADYYEKLWNEMNNNGMKDDQSFKRSYYESVRERYNKEHNPLDFMSIDRTCFNGLIRYNGKGEFNSPYHLNRNGIRPSVLRKVISEWSDLLKSYDVQFNCNSYNNVSPDSNDFIYLDPPYANTNGMYNGDFDNDEFFKWMKELKCKFALSYDGISGETDNTYKVPSDVYDKHVYVKSGNSSFKRIKQSDNNAIVYESLYLGRKNYNLIIGNLYRNFIII